ncbi:MAG: GH92 family glycosyl hydrolase [Agriterribacter sp.]
MCKFFPFRNFLLLLLCYFFATAIQAQVKTAADYVNPFIGASTSAGKAGIYHGLGKTFPGATTAYGMVQVSPNTITGGDNGSGYSYEHQSIEGFAFTQMSGIGWYGDLGNFLVMPTTGKLKTVAGRLEDKPGSGYRSQYDKQSEKASAGYYSVQLTDYNIKAEMTATPHCGMLRFTFPENKRSRIQIDLARRVGGTSTEQYIKLVNKNTIEGWMKCTPDGGGWGNGDGKADYTVYFYAQFSKPLKKYGVWNAHIPDTANRKREAIESNYYRQWIAEAEVEKNIKEKQAKHLGFYTDFATKAGEQVMMKSGISFVSMEGAKKNLEAEISDWNFDATHQKTVNLWNDKLNVVQIDGATEEQKFVFYTALYHTMIDPRIVTDVDGNYTGGDNQIHHPAAFNKRSIFSGWDVFRSQFPLQTIINPTLVNDMINSLVTLADETKNNYLERWELLNAYSGCMLGNPAVVVLADAYAKGIRNYDIGKAYQYAVNTNEKFGNGNLGYTGGSIAKTLEYAFNDWCLAQLAKGLDKTGDEKKYAARSLNYKNIWDSTHQWFRPRNEDGSWEPWPKDGRLTDWYGTFETNPYQQGWFVPHDVEGMIALMGGKQKVIADLEDFFNKTPKNFMWNSYYNHANEPVHHVPFLFNRLGTPWLTQYWTRIICDSAYRNAVEGLVGNEDVGQMSAWYVLAAIGLHPVCPGSTRLEITSPLFKQTVLHLQNGKTFSIISKNNSSTNIYIQSALLNGKPYNKAYIDYFDIMNGGTLELTMAAQPDKNFGVSNNNIVYKDTAATGFFKRKAGVVAMDGGFTIHLNDDKILWLFGDSYIDRYDSTDKTVPCMFQARNSALLQPSVSNWNSSNTISLTNSKSTDKTFLKDKKTSNHFFWPGYGYQQHDTIFVYGMNMKNAKGGLGFAKAGKDAWIKLQYPSLKTTGIQYLPTPDSIQFGCGLVEDRANGYAYIYGTKPKFISADLYVARFAYNNPAKWTYWNGTIWSDNMQTIKPVAEALSNSTTITKVDNKYLMLTAEFSVSCDAGKHIYASTSDHLTGPFSTPEIIYTIADSVQGHLPFFYLPIAHPDCINSNNELLVHYSINGYEPCIVNCKDGKFNPEYYRLQAIRVPLGMIFE